MTNVKKVKAVYSERDTRGHLTVDCVECDRGFYGSDSDKCSAGSRYKSGGKGSCFSGTLMQGLKVL
ncbi:hypothetical protein C9J27_05565 [Photobacterium kishitanii]|uniref:Uncharacterized protein n=1 Tax=Photobacterium kishitanii TaxID=318456 RepID=A0A2T3KLL0_9GAMM|nr:hypothetical protein C9J27_05565 [Photobacterium kishitanii]